MGLRINTNVEALDAQRNLNLTSMDFQKAIQRLSTGLRINSAADDPAGNSLTQTLTAQVNGFDQAQRNIQDGISLTQVANGALNETMSALQRMRTLAVQAATDTMTNSDRANIQSEVNNLISEIDRISQQTEFNNKHLLDGSIGAQAFGGGPDLKSVSAQAGVAIAGSYTIAPSLSATTSAVEGNGAGPATGSVFTTASTMTITGALGSASFTASAGETLETFFGQVNNSSIGVHIFQDSGSGKFIVANNYAGVLGTDQNGAINNTGAAEVHVTVATGDFGSGAGTLKLGFDTASANEGHIDVANTFTGAGVGSAAGGGINANNAAAAVNGRVSVTRGATTQTVTGTGLNSDTFTGSGQMAGVQFTINTPTNVAGGDAFTVTQNSALHLQIGANSSEQLNLIVDNVSSSSLGVNGLNLTTQSTAQSAIATLDTSISQLAQQQSGLGTFQNRLTNALTNAGLLTQNLQSARSQIQDANIATETIQFTRDQILLQAGTSVLAQANQNPTGLLALLR